LRRFKKIVHSKLRRMGWVRHVARVGEMKNVYKIVGKPEGKRSLGKPRSRWKDDIIIDLMETGLQFVD